MSLLTRRRAAAGAGVLALVGALIAPTAAFAADEPVVKEDRVTLETGHIDAFNLVLNADDTPRLVLKEDVTGSHVLRTPESVELFVKPDAKMTVPKDYVPGLPETIYHLPLTQDQNLIWPGWDTNALTPVYGKANTDIVVSSVDGPGKVFLWSQGQFGDTKSLLTDGGYELPGSISQPYPAHTHAAWSFTEPGTYKFTVRADVTAEDGKKVSTDEQTYTFVVAEHTKLTPEAPTQSGDTVTIPEQPWITYVDGSGETLAVGEHELTDDLTVQAVPAFGYEIATGADAEWTFSKAVPVEQKLSITGASGHYHQNTPIELQAVADPAAPDASYEWFLQRKDQQTPVKVEGQTGAQLKLTAEQALNGAQVTANLIGDDGAKLASAEAVTIEVDDHGAAPLQKVTIAGLAEHYHPGDTAELTASVDPESVLGRYEWYVQKSAVAEKGLLGSAIEKRADTAEWTELESDHSGKVSFEATEDLAGAAVKARLTYDDGTSYVESESVIVQIEDHHEEIPETELSIETDRDADDYWVGQTATLTAKQSVATGLTEYRWLAKQPGASEFTEVDEQTAAEYKFKPTLENSGVQVKAQLLHDGEVHAESAPVTITTQQRPVATTLTASADKESYAPGDVAKLTSAQDPDTGKEHYHWYVKRSGSDDFVWVDESREKDLEYPVTLEDEGAQLVLRLFDETHALIAESNVVTLQVASASEPGENPGETPGENPGEEPGTDTPGTDTPETENPETEKPATEKPAATKPAAQTTGAKGGQALATTGGELVLPVALGALLLVAGAVTVLRSRRNGDRPSAQ